MVNLRAVLGSPEGSSLPGVVLQTGAVTMHSAAVPKQQYSAARVASELLSAIHRRRQQQPQHEAAAAPGWDLEAAAASVEDCLVFNEFSLAVEGLQAEAVNVAPAEGPGDDFEPGLQHLRAPLLQPVAVAGQLKLSRLPEDAGVPAVRVALQLGPAAVMLTPALLQHVAAAAASPPEPGGSSAAAAAAPAPPAPAPAPSCGSSAASVPYAEVDLSLSSLDVTYLVAGAGNPVEAHVHLSVASGAIAFKQGLDTTALQVRHDALRKNCLHDDCSCMTTARAAALSAVPVVSCRRCG